MAANSSIGSVPESVLRFIELNIDTVPQLETLLMLSQEDSRDWLVEEVAARNYITEQRAVEILEVLRRRGLVSSEEAPRRFRFNPTNPETREVGRHYQKNLSDIATSIHSRPSSPVKEFARAYDLKKDR